MRVSVVIPAYNAAKYLAATIDSVIAQTITDWELVIVNDGSQDNTVSLAEGYAEKDPRIRVISQENGGVAAARNTGLRQSKQDTEFICYLDNDDTWEPDALAVFIEALQANAEAVAVHALPRSIDSSGNLVQHDAMQDVCRNRYTVQGRRLVRLTPGSPTTFGAFAVDNYIMTPGISMIRREALAHAGEWDESLSGWDDWDMWLRLCRFGNMIYLDRVVLNYRLHENNLSKRVSYMKQRERAFYAKVFCWPDEIPARRDELIWGYKLRSRRVSGLRLQWARDCVKSGKIVPALKQVGHAVRLYIQYVIGPREHRR
jgi:glycosyltransferase involved in cell wall biosynthesis